MSKPLFQSRFRVYEVLDWRLHDTTLRAALADVTYSDWKARKPDRALEFASSWMAELDINVISGAIVVSLYLEEDDESA